MTFIFLPYLQFLKLHQRFKIYLITRTFLEPAPTTVCGKINTLPAGNRREITVTIAMALVFIWIFHVMQLRHATH